MPDTKQDGDVLKKLEPELGAFVAACIQLALTAQKDRQYPESQQMSNLLNDIETNGDSIKLWLMENCIFEEEAFESTVILYQNYRFWSDENGVNAASRPKMRDVICTYRPNIEANRQRMADPQTGEIKLVWGLTGIRLRTVEDDFPDNDPTPDDPVDPVPPATGSGQEPHSEAIRSGDPVDSQKLSDKEEMEDVRSNAVVKSFPENHRITGSRQSETVPEGCNEDTSSRDPVAYPPNMISAQQPLLIEPGLNQSEKTDVLRYFPDLMSTKRRKRSS